MWKKWTLKRPLFLSLAAVCLLAAWFWGGGYANRGGAPPPSAPADAGGGFSAPTPAVSPPGAPDTSAPPASAAPEAPRPTDPPGTPPTPSSTPAENRDLFLTDPVPAGKPPPVEPQDARPGEAAYTCTLSVRCDTILDNLAYLDPEKHELVPPDGVIFPATTVTFSEGENAFTLLRREMQRARIHLEFVHTPLYNSAYIEGIHNLYEFDVGELSGWMYKVNGWFPNYGCSRYLLQEGDAVEFVYSCDLGRDVGGDNATQS